MVSEPIRPAITESECRKPFDDRSRACSRAVAAIEKSVAASPEFKSCFDFPRSLKEAFHIIPLSPTKVLIQAPCTRGAYNESHLYFLFDGETARRLLFPVEPAAVASSEIREKWQLKDFDSVVFTREFVETKLYALRKGLGDGSLGYYTEFEFNRDTGLPELVVTSTRTREDHKHGYSYERGKRPSGPGWTTFVPKTKLVGRLADL